MPKFHSPRRLLVALALCLSASAAIGGERTAPEILPSSAVFFAEVSQPRQLLSTIYDHELAKRVMAIDDVKSAMETKEYIGFKMVLALVESSMGKPWREFVGDAIGGGVAVAFDVKTGGAALVARATDDLTQPKLIETLVNLATLDAKNKGNDDPVETSEYRGIKVYTIDKNKLATAEGWLVATNNEDLGKQILDRIFDEPKDSLAGDANFAKARGAAAPGTTAWGFVNVESLRNSGVAKKVFEGQADNPVGELIFGGIQSNLQHTPYVTVALNVSDERLQLSATAPHDRTWAGDSRQYYFGPEGLGAAPPRLSGGDAILSLVSYRNISAMWLNAADLLDDNSNDQLAKANSDLSTLFSGKDFGEDILGAFKPEIRVVVARQEFAEGQPAPAVKLPAFGFVAELRDAEKMQPELRRTFQNLIGFFNVVGAMNGQPQLEWEMEKSDGLQLVAASFLPDPDAEDQQALRINYNFSPSIAFAGDRFVLATTKELARKLATADASEPVSSDGDRVLNSDAVIEFEALRQVLADNREQLIAQNMLKEGHTREEAEKAIAVLLELVGWLDQLKASLETTPDELRGSLEISLKSAS